MEGGRLRDPAGRVAAVRRGGDPTKQMLGRRSIERPLTRSERARMQPRDPKGRFRGYDTVMVVDEFGNVGRFPRKSETKFGYAVSVTENPDAFGAITADNRWRDWRETKARDDTSGRDRVDSRIAGLGTRTYAYYVDKTDPPKEWGTRDRRRLMLGMLSYAVDETLPETRGDVYVVVDQHTAYKDAVGPLMRSKSLPWRAVDGDKYDSHEGECADLLQTHDYVASAVRADVELGDPRRTKALRTRIHRIEDGELHD